MNDSFASQVWGNLSNLNVSNHIEKKNGLNYLSWCWAWGSLMKYYPESTFQLWREDMADGTCLAWCSLEIREGEKTLTRECWLPVMDHRNKSIVNPNSFQINTGYMRCLVKTIAMTTGLGLYIFSGEDLPEKDLAEAESKSKTPINEARVKAIKDAIEVLSIPMEKYCSAYAVGSIEEITEDLWPRVVKHLIAAMKKAGVEITEEYGFARN